MSTNSLNAAELRRHIDLAVDILRSIDSARSLSVAILLLHGEFRAVVELSIDPSNYQCPDAFARDYLAVKLLSKATWLPTGIDTASAARQKFEEVESHNSMTNQFLNSYREGKCSALTDVEQDIRLVRRYLYDTLSKVNIWSFLDNCGFGPGSDSHTRNGFTATYNKLSEPGGCTREASQYLDFLVQNSALVRLFSWDISTRRILLDVSHGNKQSVVPKNAKTDRIIAVEPRWNVYLQKGVGAIIREALKRRGLDLDNGQAVNQALACRGSRDNSFATIDLSSASDSVCTSVVRALLPARWFDLLDRLRSRSTLIDGRFRVLESFSTMGNGFTFELESLIFLSIVRALSSREARVYGDDLIVPTEDADRVIKVLAYLGFRVNKQKTFTTGPFRESCGGDYFYGVEVTPIYWKKPLKHEKESYALRDQILTMAGRFANITVSERSSLSTRILLRNAANKAGHYFGPPKAFGPIGAGSYSTHSSEWARINTNPTWDGVTVKAFVWAATTFKYRSLRVAMVSTLISPSSDGYSIRNRGHYCIRKLFVPTSVILSNDHLFETISQPTK